MGKIKGTGFSSKVPMTTKADEKYVYPIDKFVMDDNLIEGAKQLISYYRQFPHIFVEEYFLATCATNLKFRSIKMFLAFSSPFFIFSKYIFSSSLLNGSGNKLPDCMYPTPNIILLNIKRLDIENPIIPYTSIILYL